MRIITICALVLTVFTNIYAQTPEELNDILEKVYSNHPEVSAYNTQKELTQKRIEQVSNLPDPKITLGLNNLPIGSFSFNQEPMTGKTIALTQGVPFPGKLSLKSELADWDTKLVDPELKEFKLKLERDVEQIYWHASASAEKIRLTDELITLLTGVEDILATRYSLDEARKQELVSLQLEITMLEEKKEMYRGMYEAMLDKLRVLSGDESLTVSSPLPELNYVNNIPKEKLSEIIDAENPIILRKRIEAKKAEAEESLAEKEYYPDFNFTVQYSQRGELESTGKEQDDFLSFMVGFNLPINYGGKRSSRIEEAKLSQKLLSEQINGIKLNTTAAAAKELTELHSLKERIKILEEGLLPQSEVNFNTAISGLGTGVTDYLAVINALEKIVDVKFRYLDLRHDYLSGKTNLEYLLGTELNGVNNE